MVPGCGFKYCSSVFTTHAVALKTPQFKSLQRGVNSGGGEILFLSTVNAAGYLLLSQNMGGNKVIRGIYGHFDVFVAKALRN